MAVEFNAETVIAEFDALTKDAVEVQRETLRKILEENATAEYLQGCGLDGRTDVESFRAHVPLATHDDLEPYIQRIIDGDSSPLLTGKPVDSISLSSGTTKGKSKFLPFNDAFALICTQVFRMSFAFRSREFPIGGGKALQFIYGSKLATSKGGLTVTTTTTNFYRSKHFESCMNETCSECTSPLEVIFGSDYQQSLYCHLLCGLLLSDEVQIISAAFAHTLLQAFRSLELIWEDLCHDIQTGTLSPRITIPSMREAVCKLLRPDPELASRIHGTCKGSSNFYGVIPELWPNAKYLFGIMTGSMLPYVKKLRHYAGDLPLVSADYGASEGWIGLNTSPTTPPEEVTFAVTPNIAFFEFIPVSGDESGVSMAETQTVGLGEVEVGQEYEVVITSVMGLYRYRLGDVVRVTGFYNSSPMLKFVRRRSLVLNINIDKNTEEDLQRAVEDASKLLSAEKLEVIDFTSLADRSTEPPHYVVFWELNEEYANGDVLAACSNCMDKSFVDAAYVGSRKTGAIGPLELRVVKKGTFHRILEHSVSMGASVNQFKTPRCVGPANARLLEILGDNVVGSHFSTAYD